MEVSYQETCIDINNSKISREQNLLVNWQVSQNLFLITSLNIISNDNVICVLATTCEIFVANNEIFSGISDRKVQYPCESYMCLPFLITRTGAN